MEHTVAASEFTRNFGRIPDACQREPIAVTSHGRTTGYFIAAEDYEAFKRFRESRRSFASVELPDDRPAPSAHRAWTQGIRTLTRCSTSSGAHCGSQSGTTACHCVRVFVASRAFGGQEEGRKDRPVLIVLAVRKDEAGSSEVTVLPITHRIPDNPAWAIEIPSPVKRHLGLDDAPSWIVVAEGNDFIPTAGNLDSCGRVRGAKIRAGRPGLCPGPATPEACCARRGQVPRPH